MAKKDVVIEEPAEVGTITEPKPRKKKDKDPSRMSKEEAEAFRKTW